MSIRLTIENNDAEKVVMVNTYEESVKEEGVDYLVAVDSIKPLEKQEFYIYKNRSLVIEEI